MARPHATTAGLLLESGRREESDRARAPAEVQVARALARLDELSRTIAGAEEIGAREADVQPRGVLVRLSAEREVEQLLAPERHGQPPLRA